MTTKERIIKDINKNVLQPLRVTTSKGGMLFDSVENLIGEEIGALLGNLTDLSEGKQAFDAELKIALGLVEKNVVERLVKSLKVAYNIR